MRWPGDSGFTVAIWARLDAWPEPGTVGSTVDAAARGVGIPLPGEELLFRFRAVNGVGVELAVRSGGQVVSRVTGERGRVLDELTGASGAGKLAVGRWHRIIATYKTSMMGLFQYGLVWIDGVKVAEGSIHYPKPAESRLQESYIGGFHGQLASAIVLARGIDDQGANAIFAAQPSPNMDLLPPSRSMAPLVQLPAPGVSSKPTVVLEPAVPGLDSLPALHIDRPDMFAQAMESKSARKLDTEEAVSGSTDS